MSFIELLLIAAGLSMDAFAVSVCKGLASRQASTKELLCVGLWFGGFQALMPAVGYLLGSAFERYITAFDHWAAFLLLGFIGGNMIYDSIKGNTCEISKDSCSFRTMLPLAVATSMDALAVGITFALLPDVNIVAAVSLIGAITFLLSGIGLKMGNAFGLRYKAKAEFAGGLILILMGSKILLEHLGILDRLFQFIF